jgi:hypothetical protein
MRIIGGDHQVFVADKITEHRSQFFAGLTTDPAVALEIIAWLFFCDFGRTMGLVFPVLVHAFEPKRRPATAGFQMGDFQLGKFFQHSVGAEIQAGQHLFQRMASNMSAKLAVPIGAGLR